MRKYCLLLLFTLSSLLQAQSFDEWMNMGKDYMMNEEYQKALICFEEALVLQPQSSLPDQFIELVRSLIDMNETDSAAETEKFLQEQEETKQNAIENPEEDNSDIQNDFIYQQEQKDQAVRNRESGTLLLYLPVVGSDALSSNPFYSSEESSMFPNGYGLDASFYPDFLKNTLGLSIQIEEKVLRNATSPIRLNQYNVSLSIRNFFKEEVGARFILGTRIGGGISLINGLSGGIAAEAAWQASLFFSEPILYHLSHQSDSKSILAVGNVSIRYGEQYYVLEGDLGLVYKMNRIDLGINVDYVYDFQYLGESYSPLNVSLILGKNL